jgi:hypothetical protein
MINVGVDAWQCAPVDQSTLVTLIDNGANDFAPFPPSGSSSSALAVREDRAQ